VPIIIPRRSANDQPSKLVAPLFGVYYGLSDITDRRASPAELIQLLTKIRRSDALRWLASMMGWVSDHTALIPSNQLAMAEAMLPEHLRLALRQHIQRTEPATWCIFHRRQIRLLLQMAVLSCSENTPTEPV